MKYVSIKDFLYSILLLGGLTIIGTFCVVMSKIDTHPALIVIDVDQQCSAQLSACTPSEAIYSSGYITQLKGTSENSSQVFTKEQIAQLKKLTAESNLNEQTLKATSPVCSPTYDGPNVAFSYPSKYGSQKFFLCDIDNWQDLPLLQYSVQLFEKLSSD